LDELRRLMEAEGIAVPPRPTTNGIVTDTAPGDR